MDNPDLIAACVIGDGEAESGPTATFVPKYPLCKLGADLD